MNSFIGRVVEISPVREVGRNSFKIQQVVIDISTDGNANPIPVDCRGADIDTLSRCKVGDLVNVMYNLQGRAWQGKFFVNIISQTLNLVVSSKEQPIPVQKEIGDDDIMGVPASLAKSPELSDLPFVWFAPLLLTSLIQYFI